MRVSEAISRRSHLVVAGLVILTFALGWPMLFWESDETASQSPNTEITRTQELVAERFADDIFRYLFVVEPAGGDVLDREPLLALLENAAALRQNQDISENLVELRDSELGIDVFGMWTIADSVDRLLRQAGIETGLEGATEEQIDDAVSVLLGQADPLEWGLASQAEQDPDGVWHSPALFVSVAADNEGLGGGGFLVTIGTDSLEKEEFARVLQGAIAGEGDQLAVWAVAADVNLTSQDQGEKAGPFIGMTIAAVLLIVGIAFRSYWAVAVAGAALAMLMIWLRGGSNLIGLKSDQLLSTILPISMISFGIDSAFHGIGRVREEGRRGLGSRTAFVIGLGSVLGALTLAASSDASAFLANTSAGIESVVQFGVAAALATVAAFLLLGIGTPLVLSMIEGEIGGRSVTRFGSRGEMVLSILAAGLATATVLMLVFVSAAAGLGLLAVYIVLAIVAPLYLARRRSEVEGTASAAHTGSRRLGKTVATVASRPWVALAVAVLVTAGAAWSALGLEVTFDVKDFFSPDSDFVVGLDKTAEYLGDQGGEPVQVYIETDLASPAGLEAIAGFVDAVAGADESPLARDAAGRIVVNPGVLGVLEDINEPSSLENADTIAGLYDRALTGGVTDSSGTLVRSANGVGTVLWQSDDRYATVVTYQIPDTRDQTNVVRTRELLEPLAEDLELNLAQGDPDSTVVVTGSAVYRDDQLAAVRRAMLLALPIAVLACFVLAAGFMRSLRYGFVTIVPILLVVTWLYGLMYLAGYSINVVTSIISAVSIGIGIDFSTHFAMRFREELRAGASKLSAVEAAGTGTGGALAGSAFTSVAGFGILAFAPMPMFSTYGILTATMIVLALAASLFVLPSLLVVVTRDGVGIPEQRLAGRVVDLRAGQRPAIRVGLARDLSDGVVDHALRAFEERLRTGDVSVRTVPAAAVSRLIADGTLDLGLVPRWPGAAENDFGLEELPVASEAVVAVGGQGRISGDVADLEDLAHGLLIAGPHPESEELTIRLFARFTSTPVLAHTVADVMTGLRLVSITGGAMLLPTSMARAGSLPTRPLDPPVEIETRLLAAPERSMDREVFDLVVMLSEGLAADPVLAPRPQVPA